MIFEKVLAIGFSLLIFTQAYLVRRQVGTWIFPACLFGLFWFLYTFIPLIALFPAPIEPYAVGFIFLCCLAFSATFIAFDWEKAYEFNLKRTERPNYGSQFIRQVFYWASALVIISQAIDVLIQGFSFYDVIFSLMEVSSQYISRRYSDDLTANIFAQISVVLTYPAAIFGGVLYMSRQKGERGIGILLLVFIPSILVMLIQGAKGTLFLVMVLFWSGILIAKISRGEMNMFNEGDLRRAVTYALIIFPAIVASFMARGLYESDDWAYIFQGLTRYFASYSSGHLYAFSDWFSHLIYNNSVMDYVDDFGAGGFYTFMAIFKLFGSEKAVPPGVFDEYFYYGETLQSNIYTMFRGLILDFGMLGTFIFMLILGLFLHFGFWRQLVAEKPAISTSIFAHSIGFFYTSFIISLLIWNSVYASFILVSVIFFLNNRMPKPEEAD